MEAGQVLDGVETWVDDSPLHSGEGGGPVLVYTWRYADLQSRRSLEAVQALHDAYRDAGLQVVGVHAPRFSFEADEDNVADAVSRYGVDFPVGIRTDTSIPAGPAGEPSAVLLGPDGDIRAEETGVDALEPAVRQVLRRHGAALDSPVFDGRAGPQSPVAGTVSADVYAGTAYGGPLGNDHPTAPHTTVTYEEGGDREMGVLYLDGAWRREDEYVAADGSGGYAAVRFTGRECGIVVGPAGADCAVQLYDGPVPDTMYTDEVVVEGRETRVSPDTPGLYTVMARDEPRINELKILPRSDDFRLYAVCFG